MIAFSIATPSAGPAEAPHCLREAVGVIRCVIRRIGAKFYEQPAASLRQQR